MMPFTLSTSCLGCLNAPMWRALATLCNQGTGVMVATTRTLEKCIYKRGYLLNRVVRKEFRKGLIESTVEKRVLRNGKFGMHVENPCPFSPFTVKEMDNSEMPLQPGSINMFQYMKIMDELKRKPEEENTKKKLVFEHPLCDLYEDAYKTVLFTSSVWVPLIKLAVGDEDAGILGNVETEVLLRHAKPSYFGRGGKTVYDEDVRLGLEIPAQDLRFGKAYNDLIQELTKQVQENLVKNNAIYLELYKMAIYQKGGHFKKHKDTPLAKNHIATLLLDIGSEYSGGNLRVSFAGVDTLINLNERHGSDNKFCVFYTDVDHELEEVTSGLRINLQFGVYVDKSHKQSTVSKKKQALTRKPEVNEEYDEKCLAFFNSKETEIDMAMTDVSIRVLANKKIFKEMEKVMVKHDFSKSLISMPLWHLYLNGLRPTFLKGIDREFYDYFNNRFEIELHPVVFYLEFYDDDIKEQDLRYMSLGKGQENFKILSLVPQSMKLKLVHHLVDPYFYAGNEAAPEERSYFTAVFLIRGPK